MARSLEDRVRKATLLPMLVLLMPTPLLAQETQAPENCLAYVPLAQQIACLAREDQILRDQLKKLTEVLDDLKNKALVRGAQVEIQETLSSPGKLCIEYGAGDQGVVYNRGCEDGKVQQQWTLK
jgi:hypothetical protein